MSTSTTSTESSGSSFGVSSSVPINMNSAQSTLALQIEQLSDALGDQVFNWAIQNYATTSAMTDQSVANYLDMSNLGLSLAQEQMTQYSDTYVPEMNQLADLAATYSSAARVAVDVGSAESAVAQGASTGLNNARANLQSYGIDPSSGMYGELEESQNAAAGAAEAGAGVTQGEATQALGRSLLTQSITAGEQMPGDTVNDINSAYQGVAGAENAVLANAQTGANLLGAANPFLATGASVKYPPVGTVGQSLQMSSQQSSGQPNNTNQPNTTTPTGTGGNTPSTGQQTGAAASPSNSGNNLPITGAAGVDGTDTGLSGLPTDALGSTDTGTQFGDAPTDAFGGTDTFTGGATPDFENPSGALPTSTEDTGGINMPASGNTSGGVGSLPDDTSGINQPAPVDTSSDTPYTDPSSGDTGDSDSNYTPPPDSGGDYSDDSEGYARGGAVNMGIPPQRSQGGGMTTGGRVPLQASPSQGRQTDDVPARLNAGEFVVPKDVAAWKGQEFFQKLIAQSRKARLGSPAKPKAKMPLPNQHQPSFISRRMPGR